MSISSFFSKIDADESKLISRGLARRPTSLGWYKLFSTNQFKFTQKKVFDQAHPLSAKIDLSKMPILVIFRKKI